MFIGTIRYTAIRVAISFFGLVASILLYRVLGPSESGKLVLTTGLIKGLAPLISLGTAYALIKFVIGAPYEVGVSLYRRANIATALGALGTVLVLLVPSIRGLVPEEILSILPLFVVLLAVSGWQYTTNCMLRGLGRLNITSLTDGGLELLPRLLIVPWLILGVASYQLYMKLQLATVVILVLSAIFYIRRELSSYQMVGTRGNSDVSLSGYWNFVIQAQGGWLSYWMFGNASLLIVRYLGSSYEVGLLGVAMRIPMVITSLLLTPLLTPIIYYLNNETKTTQEQVDTAIRGTVLVAMLIGTGTLVLAGMAGFLVPLLFGNDYIDAVPAFKVFAHYPFLAATQIFFNPIVIKLNRQSINNVAFILGTLVQVTLGTILLMKWGLIGMAFAFVVGFLFFNVLFFGYRIRHSSPGLLFVIGKLLLVYLACTLITSTPFWPLAVIVFPFMIIWLKLLEWDEIMKYSTMVFSIIPKKKVSY